jgi:hypothetical protein
LYEALHEALIKRTYEDRLVGHISRDATAIDRSTFPGFQSRACRPSLLPAVGDTTLCETLG